MNDIKAAIKYLQDSMCDQRKGDGFQEIHNGILRIAISALEKQLNGAWIPVSERLPEEDEEVLVTMVNGSVTQAWLYLDEWNTFMSTISKDCVIAWQPLPEPYKEGLATLGVGLNDFDK